MDLNKNQSDFEELIDDGKSDHLKLFELPEISLPNQEGNLLKLNRNDTFKIVLYCYPMTGRPDRILPKNWNNIKGASGCTAETCSFRDKYDELVSLNTVPIGLSTQSVEDLKEVSQRLCLPYDIVSDIDLEFANKLNLPTFKIDNKIYIKRITLIIEKTSIKKVFYPVNSPKTHINEVLKWLKKN